MHFKAGLAPKYGVYVNDLRLWLRGGPTAAACICPMVAIVLVILYVHPGKWLQSGRPSTLVGVIPCSSRNTAVLLRRKKMW